MTKIVAISDTHGLHKQFTGKLEIPECDILIHAGDATGHGTFAETASFLNWFADQVQATHKIYVAGNHDFLAFNKPQEFDQLLPSDVAYLRDESIVVEGLKIYGSPWTPFFFDWAFNGLEEREEEGLGYYGGPGWDAKPDILHPHLKTVYGAIPEDTDVFICHGPPDLDELGTTLDGIRVGSRELLDRARFLNQLKLGLCGHIHEGRGKACFNGADWYNVASCDRSYRLIHEPVVIEV